MSEDESPETADERRKRIEEKSKRQFVMLLFLMLGLSAYIAYFTGDRFMEMQEQQAEE